VRRPGFSLVELLVALFVLTVMALAVGSFYTQTVRAWWLGQQQADLRRLTGRVQREMGRIIGPAVGLPPGSCGPPGAAASLPVQVPAQALPDPDLASGATVCFYRDPATDQLVRCQIASGGTTCVAGSEANLLTGAPSPDPIRLTDLPEEPGSGLVFRRAQGGGTWVDVSLNLGAFGPDGAMRVGPVGFSTRFVVRN
jgi:prepilin-type N-terminal cleavage/methylation domain-containing protein